MSSDAKLFLAVIFLQVPLEELRPGINLEIFIVSLGIFLYNINLFFQIHKKRRLADSIH